MFNIPELHLASIIMDLAAVFILTGLIIYTRVYRRRGYLDDRLFFHLSVIAIVMSVADAVTYALDGSTVSGSAVISLVLNNIFFIAFEVFIGILAVYMYYRVGKKKERIVRIGAYIMIPALVTSVLILINNFTRFLFWVDPVTNKYEDYKAYPIIFIAPLFYALYIVFAVFKQQKKAVILLALLVVIRIVSGFFFRGVSSTGVMFSMGLVFIHLYEMGQPYFREERS